MVKFPGPSRQELVQALEYFLEPGSEGWGDLKKIIPAQTFHNKGERVQENRFKIAIKSFQNRCKTFFIFSANLFFKSSKQQTVVE